MNPNDETAEMLRDIARQRRAFAATMQEGADKASNRFHRALYTSAAEEAEISGDVHSQLAEKLAALSPYDDAAPLLAEAQQALRRDQARMESWHEIMGANAEDCRRQSATLEELADTHRRLASVATAQPQPRPRRWHRLRVFLAVLRQLPTILRNVAKELPAEIDRRTEARQEHQRRKPDNPEPPEPPDANPS